MKFARVAPFFCVVLSIDFQINGEMGDVTKWKAEGELDYARKKDSPNDVEDVDNIDAVCLV
ncbi:hypothetical protein EDM59_23405 [Brevibacillus nitrificans]|uniref:Uncharacterized protein n=1 Tax=Brevibacillus nitrificans TaxID=651560 RepID=A0A3M8CZJ0_9BACL|nr:hypothetical protein [Brevibacillus nitrificans]RNB80305.1 hypothetical protein EDM59_23405 [Brevibacillus nitrificans]